MNQPPVVTNPSLTPTSLPVTGGDVTIRADVTDADGSVANVTAFVLSPGGGFIPVPMTQPAAGAPYEGMWTAPANTGESAAEYPVLVTALDNEDEPGEAPAGSVTVAGTNQPPELGTPSVRPRSLPTAGGPVTIRVRATDDRAVTSVFALITRPNGATKRVAMATVGGARYEGVYQVPANTTFVPVA